MNRRRLILLSGASLLALNCPMAATPKVTQWGIVYYADDPKRGVFRIVKPEVDDIELDQPPTDNHRQIYRKEDGSPHSWTTLGTNPARIAIMEKVPIDDPRAVFTGVV